MRQIRVRVNDEEHVLPEGATVRTLLEHLGLAEQPAAVEVNKALVPRRRHSEHPLRDADRVEVVTLVGGG